MTTDAKIEPKELRIAIGGEWHMEADIYELIDGEWKWASAIRTVKDADKWIAARKDPASWRVVAREVKS